MIRSLKNICRATVLSLVLGVIWLDVSAAAQAPQLELLGEIKAGLRVPTRIDVDSQGNLFVADARLQQVFKFDKFGKELLIIDQEKISGDGLAVSPAGDRIYAAAFDKVVVYDAAGELLGYLGKGAGEFTAAGFIDVDSQGFIYVADTGVTQIKVYDTSGAFNKTISGPFKSISSLAVASRFDSDVNTDELFVADSFVSSSRPALFVFSYAGKLLRVLSAGSQFSSPVRIFGKPAFDNAGRYYIADVEQGNLHIMGLAESPAVPGSPLSSSLAKPGSLSNPIDLAYDENTQRLFVVYGDRYIKVYGIDGSQNPVVVNHAPNIPVPVTPIAGSEVATLQPSLVFNNGVDPDAGDQLTHIVRVFDSADNLVATLTSSEQTATTTVSLDIDLSENGLYRWQVQAFDGQVESDWSELQSFYVNAVQEAPTVPGLIAPLASAAIRTDAVLSWQAATDADPYDTVSYLLEVAADADFGEVLYREEVVATERQVADWSAQIQPGHSYYWQVTAVDNHGLTTSSTADGRFYYQATLLNVASNMPGAQIYLGGNHSFAGQLLGSSPLKVRDLPEGRYQLVVERAGFEPFYQPVDIRLDVPAQVYAALRPALLPERLSFKQLKVAGKNINVGSLVMPLVADLDLDGIEDLLLTHADGSIHYHPGTLNRAKRRAAGSTSSRHLSFQAEQLLALPQLAGGAPCLVDWNNDYQQDLLIGTADGAVWLFRNQGDFNFDKQAILLAAVGSSAVPAVADIDADGAKDLLVGSGDGDLVLFLNMGSDEQPQLGEPQLLVAFAEAVAPTFADWDGDGSRELLVAAEGEIYHGVYSAGALLEMSLVNTEGKPIARLLALDIDEVGGKDFIAGTADGKLLRAYSAGTVYVSDFFTALESKLQQLQAALKEDASALLPLLEPMFVSIEQRDLELLAAQLGALCLELPSDSVTATIAGELNGILTD